MEGDAEPTGVGPMNSSRAPLRLVGPLLLAGGVGLIVYAITTGSASVALWVVVPVVSGGSALFLAGVGLVLLGFLALPFGLGGGDEEPGPPEPTAARGPAESGVGGLLLVGPVPIFFGSWKATPRWVRWTLALVAGLALVLLLIVALGLA